MCVVAISSLSKNNHRKTVMKGIWIPKELIDLDISWIKKALLCEISQLEELNRGCVASNSHFADKFNITSQGVSKALNELEKDGYIMIDNSQTKRNFGRTITINFSKSAINFSKSAINFSKSAINFSVESKEKKTINKQKNIDATLVSKFKEDTNAGSVAIELAEWFIKYRKSIKQPIKTIAPIKILIQEMRKCINDNYNIEEVKQLIESKEWQSVKHDWVKKEITKEKTWKE